MTDFFGSVRNTEMLNRTEKQETRSLLQQLHSSQKYVLVVAIEQNLSVRREEFFIKVRQI